MPVVTIKNTIRIKLEDKASVYLIYEDRAMCTKETRGKSRRSQSSLNKEHHEPLKSGSFNACDDRRALSTIREKYEEKKLSTNGTSMDMKLCICMSSWRYSFVLTVATATTKSG